MQLLCLLIIWTILNIFKCEGLERIGSSNFYTSIAKYDKIVIIFMDRVKDRSHVIEILEKSE
jgi:hypothetical protein